MKGVTNACLGLVGSAAGDRRRAQEAGGAHPQDPVDVTRKTLPFFPLPFLVAVAAVFL